MSTSVLPDVVPPSFIGYFAANHSWTLIAPLEPTALAVLKRLNPLEFRPNARAEHPPRAIFVDLY